MSLTERQSELVDTHRAIQDEELPYVLVGGWAVTAFQTRFTVDIDMVLFDRGINGHAVRCMVEEHGISYVAPEQKYTDEWEDIKAVEEHPDADAAVKHGVEVSADVGKDHECEQMYVPTRSDDVNENYAVFQTNHEYVEPGEIHHWPNIYRRRWDTEIAFKSLKEFLPRTSSKSYRVRFHNFVFAALVYNLWRLHVQAIVRRSRTARRPSNGYEWGWCLSGCITETLASSPAGRRRRPSFADTAD